MGSECINSHQCLFHFQDTLKVVLMYLKTANIQISFWICALYCVCRLLRVHEWYVRFFVFTNKLRAHLRVATHLHLLFKWSFSNALNIREGGRDNNTNILFIGFEWSKGRHVNKNIIEDVGCSFLKYTWTAACNKENDNIINFNMSTASCNWSDFYFIFSQNTSHSQQI